MASNKEVEMGFEFLDALPRYRRVNANMNLMSDALHAENGRKITPDVLRQIFARIQPQLAISPEYAEAYGTFFEQHPEFRLESNMGILDSKLIEMRLLVTFENLEDLVQPGNPRNVLHQLGITAAAAEAIAEAKRLKAEVEYQAKETDRMVAEITAYQLDANGDVKFEYSRQYKDKIAGLRAMPFDALTARYEEVIAARDVRRAPVEAVRAVVKTEAKEQRKDIFSIEPPAVELINPNTGKPFTGRKELVNFFNGLSRPEMRAFFYFPEGRQKPGVQEAVSKILKGTVK